MIGRDWTIGTYHFYDEGEYQAALRDQKLINSIHDTYNLQDLNDLDKLYKDISRGQYRFESIIGRDFDDEIYEKRKQLQDLPTQDEKRGVKTKKGNILSIEKKQKKTNEKKTSSRLQKQSKKAIQQSKAKQIRQESRVNAKEKKDQAIQDRLLAKFKKQHENDKKPVRFEDYDKEMQKAILAELRKQERRRKIMVGVCSVLSVCCIGYFGYYIDAAGKSSKQYDDLADAKEQAILNPGNPFEIKVHKSTSKDVDKPNVLTAYEKLYSQNEKLIGWLKIADTVIDYPVMQTTDNEYFLKHNFEDEEDKNGCIFMDSQCDVINRSNNLILYGHHMQSGNMFGTLYKYQDETYGREHATIQFDTIYEKGTYEVMYVFRSRVYSEEDVSFKYYQFINANSAKEYKSYMNEMAAISFYDTGVTASYGDQLLTLSTCDYEESDGRFVVVCKRVK